MPCRHGGHAADGGTFTITRSSEIRIPARQHGSRHESKCHVRYADDAIHRNQGMESGAASRALCANCLRLG